MKKVLYGICGIGNGHFFRQIPVIDFLISQHCQIMFFAYGESLKLLSRYHDNPLVNIIEVAVPYFISNTTGVDFVISEKINAQFDYSINLKAFSQAQQWLGKPDLVISDYEPVCAQYGYAYNCPVVTIDQQSKFFTKNTDKEINGYNCEDELMRLNMFFPIAKRLACSFFKLRETNNVTIIPPIHRDSIKKIIRKAQDNEFLIYISAQSGFSQTLNDIVTILKDRTEVFHIFTKEVITPEVVEHLKDKNNIFIHAHGSSEFEKLLSTCSGVISTAGHNLLGECMFLNIPVYAMPMGLYEQQLNAKIIGDYFYGLNHPTLDKDKLHEFIGKKSFYLDNMRHSEILFRESGETKLIQIITSYLN